MLTYDYGAPDVIEPTSIKPGIVEFDTKKYDDFTVFDVNLKAGQDVEHVFSEHGPCVLLVHEGSGGIAGEKVEEKIDQHKFSHSSCCPKSDPKFCFLSAIRIVFHVGFVLIRLVLAWYFTLRRVRVLNFKLKILCACLSLGLAIASLATLDMRPSNSAACYLLFKQ